MATAQATSDPQLGFPVKGSLKRIPFPRLMREVARNKLTGSLYLLSGQTKKVVFFEEGQPVFVRSNVLSECLGQILSTEGLITQEQCEQTLEAIRRTGKKQGELLVEMGILSEGNLRYGLEAQLRAKLFEIFSWEEGRYQFKSDPPNLQFGIRLKVSAEGVIVAGIQNQYTEARALEALEPHRDRYPVVRSGFEVAEDRLELLPEELYFVTCLDGSRTVRQVVEDRSEPAVPTPAALVYGLLQAGIVQLSERPLEAKPRPAFTEPDASAIPDDELAPAFEGQNVITEYEDTPLPGELPKVRGLLDDHEDDFAGVEDDEPVSSTVGRPEIPEDLVAAEPESVEETFDEEQIELLDDEVELVDGPALLDDVDLLEPGAQASAAGHRDGASALPEIEPELSFSDLHRDDAPGLDAASIAADDDLLMDGMDDDLLLPEELDDVPLADPDDLARRLADVVPDLDPDPLSSDPVDLDPVAASTGSADELVDFDELDHVDLGDALGPEPARHTGAEATFQERENPEMLGAMRFNEAETVLRDGQFARAVGLLEEAYAHGFDVAELHAMLAYARFMTSGRNAAAADRAFELLEYAQSMDPSLDLVHAYRGAIYRVLQRPEQAREALDRALELNPYCELAMELMDQLA